jgi:3'-phosphoadenosine 5'-phosphosulfate sulfotransferase (PAPS reductase)/FAD synthetase
MSIMLNYSSRADPINESQDFCEIKEKYKKFYREINTNFFIKIKNACVCIEEFFQEKMNNKTNHFFISFNGGKDCLAALILFKYFFYCKTLSIDYTLESSFNLFLRKENDFKFNSCSLYKFYFIYFVSEKAFDEELAYVRQISIKENVETFYLNSDFVSGLKFLIKNFDLDSVVMGTRRDDMLGSTKEKINKLMEEKLIHPSSQPYPSFTRFYPIFNFTFEDIWRIILITNYPYLDLYDKGYSSIGKKHNTFVNPNLKYENDEGVFYLPAWCLSDSITERSFRSLNC